MWTEETKARLALPVDEWWSLMVKRAYEAGTGEAYQIKLDIDAEIVRLEAEVANRDEWRTIAEELRGKLDKVTRLYNDIRTERDALRETGREKAEAERDAALVHGPEDMIRALEEQRTLIETLEGRIKGLHFANDSFGDVIARAEKAEAEVERLRHSFTSVRVERDGLLTSEQRHLDIITKLEAERDALRAEVDRLRKFGVERGAKMDAMRIRAEKAEAALARESPEVA